MQLIYKQNKKVVEKLNSHFTLDIKCVDFDDPNNFVGYQKKKERNITKMMKIDKQESLFDKA